MYTTTNFKTKKALKEAVAAYNEYVELGDVGYRTKHGLMPSQMGAVMTTRPRLPKPVTCYSPGMFPCPNDGNISLEGPHFPEPHKWYGTGTMKDGILIFVK